MVNGQLSLVNATSFAGVPAGVPVTFDELSDRLMDAAVRAGKVADALPDTRMGRHVAGQLIRCGTSSGPNYEEGRAAESRRDFIHKLRVCLKELRETRYWLRFIARADLLSEPRLADLIQESEELIRIIAKSIATAESGGD
jgi:four helix bundle protein